MDNKDANRATSVDKEALLNHYNQLMGSIIRKLAAPVMGEAALKHYDGIVNKKISDSESKTDTKLEELENKVKDTSILDQKISDLKTEVDTSISDVRKDFSNADDAIKTEINSTIESNRTALDKKIDNAVIDINTKLATLPTSTDLGNAIASAMRSVYKYKGSVATEADLPTGYGEAQAGWIYNIEKPNGMNVAWDGEKWDALGASVMEIVRLTPEEYLSILDGGEVPEGSKQSVVDALAYKALYDKAKTLVNSDAFLPLDGSKEMTGPLKMGENRIEMSNDVNLFQDVELQIDLDGEGGGIFQAMLVVAKPDADGFPGELLPIRIGLPNSSMYDGSQKNEFAATIGYVLDKLKDYLPLDGSKRMTDILMLSPDGVSFTDDTMVKGIKLSGIEQGSMVTQNGLQFFEIIRDDSGGVTSLTNIPIFIGEPNENVWSKEAISVSAATRGYVDESIKNLDDIYFRLDGSKKMTGSLMLNYNKLYFNDDAYLNLYESENFETYQDGIAFLYRVKNSSGGSLIKKMPIFIGEPDADLWMDNEIDDAAATRRYVKGLIGDIGAVLDRINGEVV